MSANQVTNRLSGAESFFELFAQRVAALVIEQMPAPQALEGSPWFDVNRAAEYAGMTPDAIRSATKRGQLRVHRSETGRLRYHRDDLDAFLCAEDAA